MSVKTTVQKAGDAIAETAAKVGHRVEETVEQAADWAKQKLHKAGNRIEESAQKVKNDEKRESCDTSCETSR